VSVLSISGYDSAGGRTGNFTGTVVEHILIANVKRIPAGRKRMTCRAELLLFCLLRMPTFVSFSIATSDPSTHNSTHKATYPWIRLLRTVCCLTSSVPTSKLIQSESAVFRLRTQTGTLLLSWHVSHCLIVDAEKGVCKSQQFLNWSDVHRRASMWDLNWVEHSGECRANHYRCNMFGRYNGSQGQ
jgi:hypothetical protein